MHLGELRSPEKKAKEVVAALPAFGELLPRRKFGTYKNQCGRIGVVAGSRGFIGAALMTSQGALRAGAGLVEVFVPEEIYEIVAGAAPMESMVKPLKSYRDLLKEKADVWAVGPGLGKSRAAEILELIEKAKQPMVIDADALNILAEKTSTLKHCKGKRLLTPHPGEMKRLWPDGKEARAKTATKFCQRFAVTLLLKGSRTIVAERAITRPEIREWPRAEWAIFSPESAQDWWDKVCLFMMRRESARGYAAVPRKSRSLMAAKANNRYCRAIFLITWAMPLMNCRASVSAPKAFGGMEPASGGAPSDIDGKSVG